MDIRQIKEVSIWKQKCSYLNSTRHILWGGDTQPTEIPITDTHTHTHTEILYDLVSLIVGVIRFLVVRRYVLKIGYMLNYSYLCKLFLL